MKMEWAPRRIHSVDHFNRKQIYRMNISVDEYMTFELVLVRDQCLVIPFLSKWIHSIDHSLEHSMTNEGCEK